MTNYLPSVRRTWMSSLCIVGLSWGCAPGRVYSVGRTFNPPLPRQGATALWGEGGEEAGCKGDEQRWVEAEEPPRVRVEAWESPRWVEVARVWEDVCDSCCRWGREGGRSGLGAILVMSAVVLASPSESRCGPHTPVWVVYMSCCCSSEWCPASGPSDKNKQGNMHHSDL